MLGIVGEVQMLLPVLPEATGQMVVFVASPWRRWNSRQPGCLRFQAAGRRALSECNVGTVDSEGVSASGSE